MKVVHLVFGACIFPAALIGQNTAAFKFDTTHANAISATTSTVGSTADACFSEMRATVVNLGVTNATCQVVFIPRIQINLGSTNALQVDATASHVRNASGQSSGKLNASGALQTCRVVTQHSACWGATLVSQDSAGAVGVLNGLEVDVNVQNPTPAYIGPAGNPAGVRAVLVGTHPGSIGTAYTAQKLGSGLSSARWSVGFLTTDSGAATGMSLGALGTSPRQGGQPIVLHYRDVNGTDNSGQINVDEAGNLLLRSGNKGNGTETINQNSLLISNGRFQDVAVALECGGRENVTIDASEGNYFVCDITSDVPVTIQPPTNHPSTPSRSQLITIAIRNSSGRPLTRAPSFSTAPSGFKVSPVSNPTNKSQVLYTFRWDPSQSFWYEVGMHQADGL